MRASVFSILEDSPECVAVTLRCEIAGRWWDVTLSCVYYTDPEDPADEFSSYFWDASEALEIGSPSEKLVSHLQFERPADAFADAEAQLAAYVPGDDDDEALAEE